MTICHFCGKLYDGNYFLCSDECDQAYSKHALELLAEMNAHANCVECGERYELAKGCELCNSN